MTQGGAFGTTTRHEFNFALHHATNTPGPTHLVLVLQWSWTRRREEPFHAVLRLSLADTPHVTQTECSTLAPTPFPTLAARGSETCNAKVLSSSLRSGCWKISFCILQALNMAATCPRRRSIMATLFLLPRVGTFLCRATYPNETHPGAPSGRHRSWGPPASPAAKDVSY